MNMLDLQDEKFKTVEVKNKKFKIRAMSPMDRVMIAQRRMKFQGGNPVSAMTEDDFIFFENMAIVDTCVEELPKGTEFKEGESCARWDDIDTINEVSDHIRTHTMELEAQLKKNKPIAGIPEE
jgi:hypothetical protein